VLSGLEGGGRTRRAEAILRMAARTSQGLSISAWLEGVREGEGREGKGDEEEGGREEDRKRERGGEGEEGRGEKEERRR
jgi:hypothetical protein